MLVEIFQCYLTKYKLKTRDKYTTILEYKKHSDSLMGECLNKLHQARISLNNKEKLNRGDDFLHSLAVQKEGVLMNTFFTIEEIIENFMSSFTLRNLNLDLKVKTHNIDSTDIVVFQLFNNSNAIARLLECELFHEEHNTYYKLASHNLDYLIGWSVDDVSRIYQPGSSYAMSHFDYLGENLRVLPILPDKRLRFNYSVLEDNHAVEEVEACIKYLLERKIKNLSLCHSYDEDTGLFIVGLDIPTIT